MPQWKGRRHKNAIAPMSIKETILRISTEPMEALKKD
jgi:hypothetical protein